MSRTIAISRVLLCRDSLSNFRAHPRYLMDRNYALAGGSRDRIFRYLMSSEAQIIACESYRARKILNAPSRFFAARQTEAILLRPRPDAATDSCHDANASGDEVIAIYARNRLPSSVALSKGVKRD